MAGGEGGLYGVNRTWKIEGSVEDVGDAEFEGGEVRGVFEEVVELVGGFWDVGADDDETAIGVGFEILHLPRIEGWAAGDADEGLDEGGGGADDEASVGLVEGDGEGVEIAEGGGVDDAGGAGGEGGELG